MTRPQREREATPGACRGPLVTGSAGEDGDVVAEGTPTIHWMTDELAAAELLLLDRVLALRDAAEGFAWHWAPDATGPSPRQALSNALVELARAVALDAKRADFLAEPMQW